MGGAAVPREVAFPIGGDLPNFRLRDGAFCHHSFLSWYNLLEVKKKGDLLNPKNFPELFDICQATAHLVISKWRPSESGPMLILDGYANLAESDTVYTHSLMCKGKVDYKVKIIEKSRKFSQRCRVYKT